MIFMVSFEAAIKEANLAIEHCYSVKKGENVAILTDQDHMVEAKALGSVAGQVGANVVLLDASAYVQAGMLIAGIPEPPTHISSLMEKTQVFIIKTDMDFAHRFAHTEAARIVERNKGRIAAPPPAGLSWTAAGRSSSTSGLVVRETARPGRWSSSSRSGTPGTP